MSEQLLVQQLDSCADLVKTTKESQRLNTLLRELEPIHFSLSNNSTSLPIGPSIQVNGLEVRLCSYFPSNTLPLKLAFHSAEPEGKPESVQVFSTHSLHLIKLLLNIVFVWFEKCGNS